MHPGSIMGRVVTSAIVLSLGIVATIPGTADAAARDTTPQASVRATVNARGPADLTRQRRIGPRTTAKSEPGNPPTLRVGPACTPVVATLSNGAYSTDGSLNISVDGLGAFGTAVSNGPLYAYYNPIGRIDVASTIFRSWLYVGTLGTFLQDTCSTVESVTSRRLVTTADLGSLRLRVTQSVGAIGAKGTTFTQSYRITNQSGAPLELVLARYVDGDLYLIGGLGDDGGAASANGSVLYEFEWSDDHRRPSTYVGMSGSLDGDRTPDRWTVQTCCRWDEIVSAGHIPSATDHVVDADADGDRMVDSPYDVTMSQEWGARLSAGASVTFTATTRFGRADFDEPAPTAKFNATWQPGSRDVVFDARPSANAVSWRWDFGDGSPTQSGQRPTHTFPRDGEFEVTLTVGGGGGQIDASTETVAVSPVRIYAPNAHLHPNDPVQPWSADEFIKASMLMWSRDGRCDDQVFESAGHVVATKLTTGGYTARRASDVTCRPTGRRWFTSAERTAPWHNRALLGLTELEEGFYLDLPESAYGGDISAAHVYWSYVPRKSVTYWFFFPYNDYSVDHEGDWEHVTVLLDAHGAIESVQYFRHRCAPKVLTVREIEDGQDGSSFAGGSHHPDVWVAKGSHAMYWRSGSYTEYSDCMGGTDEMADGLTWPTLTAGVLQRLGHQPWRGYGGGWGQATGDPLTSGPEGPH